jgi:replicative DNA helicase
VNREEPILFDSVGGSLLDRLRVEKEKEIEAVPTPFESLNWLCGEEGGRQGLAKGWMIVVGGIPGAGKTNFGLNLAAHAVAHGRKVGDVNFEMSQSAAATRFMSILTGVPKRRIERGENFDEEAWEWGKSEVDAHREDGGELLVNREALFYLDDIEESYRVLADQGADLIMVDYAQLIAVSGADGIFQRTEAVANRLRSLTKKYNVVTLALSQFNRETTKNPDKPPSRAGLQGGSAWENNANMVLLLNHAKQLTYLNEPPGYQLTEVIVDKNRHGPPGQKIPVRWDFGNFRCREYDSDGGELPDGRVEITSDEQQEKLQEEAAQVTGDPDWDQYSEDTLNLFD